MSRTKHHNQNQNLGSDYSGKFLCNKMYCNLYNKFGRKKAHKEMREQAKQQCKEVDQ